MAQKLSELVVAGLSHPAPHGRVEPSLEDRRIRRVPSGFPIAAHVVSVGLGRVGLAGTGSAIIAWAMAKRAAGTRNGEHDT